MFKRMMRWLCGEETEPVRVQLHRWIRAKKDCRRAVVTPLQYAALISELYEAKRILCPTSAYGPQGVVGIIYCGVEIFPDPSVTEFTNR